MIPALLATAGAFDACDDEDWLSAEHVRVCPDSACCAIATVPCVGSLQAAVDLLPGPVWVEIGAGTYSESVVVDGKAVRFQPYTYPARWVDAADAEVDAVLLQVLGGATVCMDEINMDLVAQRAVRVASAALAVHDSYWSTRFAASSADGALPAFIEASGSDVVLDHVGLRGRGTSFGARANPAIGIAGTRLTLVDSSVRDASRVIDGGLSGGTAPNEVVLAGFTEFRDNLALGYSNGGGLVSGAGTLTIEGARLIGNAVATFDSTPTRSGLIRWRGDVVLRDAVLVDNLTPTGAMLEWLGSGSLLAERVDVCGNSSEGLAAEAAESFVLLALQDGDTAVVRNSRIVQNDGGIVVRTAAAAEGVSIHNNAILGNRAPYGSVVRGSAGGFGVEGPSTSTLFTNNLVVANADLSPQAGGLSIATGVTLRSNLWWGNSPERLVGTADPSAIQEDPRLVDVDVSCDLIGPSDFQTGLPSFHGPAIDRGDPASVPGVATDRDGTRLDIGPFGGPYGPADAWEDADVDGVPRLFDCDEGDPTVGAGLDDPPYDGIDSDCAGDDDFDHDGDGHRPTRFGGEDCNDDDPTAFPGATEVPANGVDEDCDGWADEGDDLRGRGCAHLPRPGITSLLSRRSKEEGSWSLWSR
ncbi:MAG: putative metal-binding motif-containing protein [Alphaproteobacteria bacterium]|nr:putative metal-binding motif-containing protein [Alphaproteobacteria bacterium]MCB9694256.1 putative metal-binding motif-containing protein [Alphaproteobacteria bacterium]